MAAGYGFVSGGAILILAGIELAKWGDVIAVRTRLGGMLVGLLLVAAATSLPELVTDISAAAAGSPKLAVGVVGALSPSELAVGWVGVDTLLIGVGYVAAVAWLRRSPSEARLEPAVSEVPAPTHWGEAEERPPPGLRKAAFRFAVAAAAVLVAAPVTALSAKALAELRGSRKRSSG